jgi:voltage-gated potassium channel
VADLTQVRKQLGILRRLDKFLEIPMMVLAFAWLVLMIVDFVYGLNQLGLAAFYGIWGLFVIEFVLKFTLAPKKTRFMARNWLPFLALFVPALRILRPLRLLSLLRGAQLVRFVATLKRSMNALGSSLGRKGIGYVGALTALVIFAGAAGMFFFERGADAGFTTYGEAVWWTAMTLTTTGADFWPVTNEGRFLAFLISLYGLGVFGYVAASLASFFVERDAEAPEAETVGKEELRQILAELQELKRLKGDPA